MDLTFGLATFDFGLGLWTGTWTWTFGFGLPLQSFIAPLLCTATAERRRQQSTLHPFQPSSSRSNLLHPLQPPSSISNLFHPLQSSSLSLPSFLASVPPHFLNLLRFASGRQSLPFSFFELCHLCHVLHLHDGSPMFFVIALAAIAPLLPMLRQMLFVTESPLLSSPLFASSLPTSSTSPRRY